MTTEPQRQPRNLVTLVVRLWPVGSTGGRRGWRYQATHVQTGEAVYFQDVDGLIGYLERLRGQLDGDPLGVASQSAAGS